MGNIHVISLLVVTWLIVNESISILENLVLIGVPFPSFLSRIVQRLKTSVEQKGEQLTEEEVEAEDAADAEEDEETTKE